MAPVYHADRTRALGHFLKFLGARGFRVPVRKEASGPALRAVPSFEPVLEDYRRFLVDHRGLAPRTVTRYTDHAAGICRHLVAAQVRSFDDLTPRVLYDHFLGIVRRRRHADLRTEHTSLRNFFRFLRTTGQCAKDLAS